MVLVRAFVRSFVLTVTLATAAAVGLVAPAHAEGGNAPQLSGISGPPSVVHVGNSVYMGAGSTTDLLLWAKFTFSGSNGGERWAIGTSSNGSGSIQAGIKSIGAAEAGVHYTLQSVVIQSSENHYATYKRDGTVTNESPTTTGPATHSLDFSQADFDVAPTPPGAPGNVTGSPGDGRAHVTWSTAAAHGDPITSYVVTTSPGGAEMPLDSSARSAVVEGLENGTAYKFSVRAVNSLGDSDTADTGWVTPGPGLGKPSPPQAVTAHARVNKAKVSWQAPVFDGGSPVTGFTATASPGGQTCTTAAAASTCDVPGLTNGVAYTFTVTAKNNSGVSDPSAPSNQVTPTTDTHAPAVLSTSFAPKRVSSLGGSVTVDLHITDDVSGSLSSIYVFFRKDGSPNLGVYSANRVSGDEYDGIYRATATIPAGTAIGLYELRIFPTEDAAGNDGTFVTLPGITIGTPTAPTNVTASADGTRQVTVNWDAPADNGGNVITGYRVTAAPGGQTYDAAGTSLSTSFAAWPADTPVSFTVKAINAAGTSDASAPSTPLTVTATAPAAPAITTTGALDRSIGVSWNAPTSTGGSPITSYTATAHPGGAFCTAAGSGCIIDGLQNGTAYTVTVTATNAGGTSLPSAASGPVTPYGPVLAFQTATATVNEASGGLSLVVVRTGNTAVPSAVSYASSGGSATLGSDYGIIGSTLSFAAGQTTKTISIPIVNDAAREADETIEVTLSAPSDGAALAAPQTATVTIHDDDTAVASFSTPGRNVTEVAGTLLLTVTRGGNTGIPASVDYSSTGGSATVGSDVTFAPGTLEFAAGETSKTIPVTIINDGAREGQETLTIGLQPGDPDTALGSISSFVVFIGSSDQQPDALVSTSPGSGFAGNNVYNSTGAGQSKTAPVRRGTTRVFWVRVYNDGNAPATITVRGTAAAAGSTVKYFANSTDITAGMLSSRGRSVTLAPGQFALIQVRITALRTARVGSLKSAKVTATWTGDGTRTDVVKSVAKVG